MTDQRDASSMIRIDGSLGEGGGQMLRSALALSMVTGRGFAIDNIRAGRPKPGLMRQHLTCVNAAAEISSARVDGAAVGSRRLTFVPGRVRPGSFSLAVGTAGSVILVLQAILPALVRAGRDAARRRVPAEAGEQALIDTSGTTSRGASSVIIEGGTHVKGAPPYEFLERTLLPILNRSGAGVTSRLERHGFYPAGGGRVVVDIAPAEEFTPIELTRRGPLEGVSARAIVSLIPRLVARRELDVLRDRLDLSDEVMEIHQVGDAVGAGNAASVELRYQGVTEIFAEIGERGRSSEDVARSIADRAKAYMNSDAPVGEHLADQLMTPAAAMAGGRFRAAELSSHATTNLAVLEAFGCGVRHDGAGTVEIEPIER